MKWSWLCLTSCSYRILIVLQIGFIATPNEKSPFGIDVRCPIVALAGHCGAVPFTLALVSRGMLVGECEPRHGRCAILRWSEAGLIADL